VRKSDLIESWLNSEITEDEAILLLERMKHDDKFTKELVEAGEVHACLYTIFHEDTSFDELKLHELSKSPDEIEDQIMHMISVGQGKEKTKKKRITIIDLPQNVTTKTKSFEKPKNYWPIIAAVAAILLIIITLSILTKPAEPPQNIAKEPGGSLTTEGVVLVKDNKHRPNKVVKLKEVIKRR